MTHPMIIFAFALANDTVESRITKRKQTLIK